jgi:hypothetical protein
MTCYLTMETDPLSETSCLEKVVTMDNAKNNYIFSENSQLPDQR